MNIFGCLSSHRRIFGCFLTSIQFVWVYGRAWQWQMQQWTCSGGFIKCFTTTFINPQSTHRSTHSQPHFYTFTLNKVDADNWWWWGWFERETIWQRNEIQSTGSVWKTITILFPIFMLGGGGGGGVIIFIMWRECGKTKTILFPIFMLERDNTIYNGPPTRPHFLWYVG